MKDDFKLHDELILVSIRSVTLTGEDEFNIGLAEGNLREMMVKAKYLEYLNSDILIRNLHADVIKVKIKGVELLIKEDVMQYNAIVTVGDPYLLNCKCSTGIFKGINKKETYKYIWGLAFNNENKDTKNILYKGFMEYEYLKRVLTSKAVKNREFTNQFIKMIDEVIGNSKYT